MPGRISSLHALRGLAALCVAVGHAYYFGFDGATQVKYLGANLFDTHHGLRPGFALYKHTFSGTFPVAAFFLLSGFVLEGSLKRLAAIPFLINRALRIYPTYLLALTMHVALLYLLAKPPSMEQVVQEASLYNYFDIMSVGWTLFFEVRYYLLIALLCLVGATSTYRPWIILLFFLYFGGGLLFWMSFMAIGAVSAQVFYSKAGYFDRAIHKMELPIFVVLWVYFALVHYKINLLHNLPASELVAALIVFWAALAARDWNFDLRALRFFGDISYPLYCTHFPVVALAHYFFASAIPINIIAPFSLALATALAWIVHVYVERPTIAIGASLSARASKKLPARPWYDLINRARSLVKRLWPAREIL